MRNLLPYWLFHTGLLVSKSLYQRQEFGKASRASGQTEVLIFIKNFETIVLPVGFPRFAEIYRTVFVAIGDPFSEK